MDTPAEFKEGFWCYGSKAKSLETLDFPNPRQWSPADEDWKLPENWQEIVLKGMKDLLGKPKFFDELKGSQFLKDLYTEKVSL